MRVLLATSQAPKAIGPYSQGLSIGNFIFCSGQIGMTVDNHLVSSSVREQAQQAMRNLGTILDAGQATFADVVQSTIYLTNLDDYAVVNDVYGSFFIGCPCMPTRSTVVVQSLPKQAFVEISMIAVR